MLKTVWNSLGAFDKGKNDVTSGCPADLKLSENVCYSILFKVRVHQSKTFYCSGRYIKITKKGGKFAFLYKQVHWFIFSCLYSAISFYYDAECIENIFKLWFMSSLYQLIQQWTGNLQAANSSPTESNHFAMLIVFSTFAVVLPNAASLKVIRQKHEGCHFTDQRQLFETSDVSLECIALNESFYGLPWVWVQTSCVESARSSISCGGGDGAASCDVALNLPSHVRRPI